MDQGPKDQNSHTPVHLAQMWNDECLSSKIEGVPQK